MSKILELILCGCIVLIIGGSSSGGSGIGILLAMADDTMTEDKSIELLQQHLCRDECYKKVCNLCPTKLSVDSILSDENILSIRFPNPIPSLLIFPSWYITCLQIHMRICIRRACNDPKRIEMMLRCRLCKWIPMNTTAGWLAGLLYTVRTRVYATQIMYR